MRSDVAQFGMVAPGTVAGVLALLRDAPGRYAPMAGGTELMVALNTGRLGQREFVSLQGLDELRFIRVEDEAIHIGAGTTFTDIRQSGAIAEELPLLVQSASWTGSVANQNRGTLGGNICNGSPAADNPPVLLAYGATVTLRSASGERTVPYEAFHLGYKKTAMQSDELLVSVAVPRGFGGHKQYIRKVGTRNAQAISKVALAAVASLDGGVIREVRLGAASLADRPMRCAGAEAALTGKAVNDDVIRAARAALAREAKPIDDIRSTAKYRAHVIGNLLEEFLRTLG